MTEPTEQELARFVDANVHLCLSSLVSTLAHGNGLPPRAAGEELSALCGQAADLCSPVEDYEEAARQAGWTGPHKDEFNATFFRDDTDGQTWSCASWQELCEAHDIEPYEWEIFEHWAVTEWFAEQLEARGERVDRDFAGLCVWGRTTTGQAISMDAVIKEIWRELHKEEA